MSKKVVLVAFNGEAMCFVHVLLNALDMKKKEYDVKIVIEGSATKLIKELNKEDNPFSKMYQNVRSQGLIDCVCKACLEQAEEQGLPLFSEMMGHPSIANYMDQGYEVITF